MKFQKFFPVILLLVTCSLVCPGQEFKEVENWIGTIEGGTPIYLIHRLQNYTDDDVIKAKEKLNLIKQAPAVDEWEGSYILNGHLSDKKLFWNTKFGFVNYYIYTCAIELRLLNYGRTENNPDSVILTTEKNQAPFMGMDNSGQVRFVKVKWGDLHYLVEEDDLETFCELAAGYYGAGKPEKIEKNGESYFISKSIWDSFWMKITDSQKNKAFGLPILPGAYEKFVKQPIEAKIISIGKYEKDPPNEGTLTYARRYLTIDAGKYNGVKADMEFYAPALENRIKIVKVSDKTSVAVLETPLDSETREETCVNVSGEETPCKPVKAGMNIKTVPDEFLEND